MDELGKLVDVVKSQVSNWESGKRKPGITSLHKLTELFGVDFVDMDTNRVYEPIAEYKSINKSEEKKSVPFYDTEVFATISPAMSDVVTMKPSTFVQIPIFSQGEMAFQATGHSMKGYINHGDWIICKRIIETRDIIYGEAYFIVTKTDKIKTVKFLKKGNSEDTFLLLPYNVAQFEPQEIYKDSILEIYKVIGLFRSV